MRRFLHLTSVFMALASVSTSGCGSGVGSQSAARPEGPLPVLARSALPGLTVKDLQLTTVDLTHDAPISGFSERLAGWGFQRGTQREFRTTSRTATFSDVVSRTLEFRGPAGARAYVALVGAQAGRFFGNGSRVLPLESGGRSGYLVRLASCGCHGETPALLAVVAGGPRVTWLLGNGPGASPATLRTLLAKAP
jgi:hypothetical protein